MIFRIRSERRHVNTITIFSDNGSGFASHYFVGGISLLAIKYNMCIQQNLMAPYEGKGPCDRSPPSPPPHTLAPERPMIE
jgi:hypothetical protein